MIEPRHLGAVGKVPRDFDVIVLGSHANDVAQVRIVSRPDADERASRRAQHATHLRKGLEAIVARREVMEDGNAQCRVEGRIPNGQGGRVSDDPLHGIANPRCRSVAADREQRPTEIDADDPMARAGRRLRMPTVAASDVEDRRPCGQRRDELEDLRPGTRPR